MFDRLRRLFSGEDEPRFVTVEVEEEQIREMLKGDRDFVVRTTEAGEVSAECKQCRAPLDVALADEIVWYRCRGCNRYSFNAVGNAVRDMHLAQKDGKPLVYELFYFKEIPPGLKPPFE